MLFESVCGSNAFFLPFFKVAKHNPKRYSEYITTLIVTVSFGLVIAYFATQNSGTISLNFLNYTIPGIPAYIVVVGALLVGLSLSWIISFINGIGTSFALWGKDNKIKDSNKENAEYLKKIHQLEIENTRLKAETNSPDDDKSL